MACGHMGQLIVSPKGAKNKVTCSLDKKSGHHSALNSTHSNPGLSETSSTDKYVSLL
jgi:hypothetical protein